MNRNFSSTVVDDNLGFSIDKSDFIPPVKAEQKPMTLISNERNYSYRSLLMEGNKKTYANIN